ncbi:condensation domain-containing protein, partial [Candidatus Dojkabacteria bacterium]|nr:condensation domain-containing protein [Candidatus Dojkabacteria bacterium]
MVSRARQQGIMFDVRQVFETPTIAELVVNSKQVDKSIEINQGPATGIVQLLPIQQWFFEKARNVNHFNQASWIISKEDKPIDINKLKDILVKIYNHHDAFKIKFRRVNGLKRSSNKESIWEQYYDETQNYTNVKDIPFEVIDENSWSKDKLNDICTKIQSSLNIEKGPLSRLVWFEGKGLFWVIHHIIVDGVSWRILLEDLNTLYENKSLSLKSHSYQAWGKFLQQYDKLDTTNEYYRNLPNIILSLKQESDVSKINHHVVTYSKELTRDFIQKAQKAYRTQANDLLLTALVQSFGEYTNNQLCINLEGHGRETLDSNLDLTRTIGWFTSIYPVYLKLSDPTNLDRCIKEVKEQLRQIPEKGITYGIASSIQHQIPLITTNIAFNYLGQWDTTDIEGNTFKLGNDYIGQCSSEADKLLYKIDINGQIQDGILSFNFTFNYQESIIQEIANSFKEKLEALVVYCLKEGVYGYTPSDFELVRFSQEKLDTTFHQPLETIYPLSPIQGGLLFQALYQPESDAYFTQSVFELESVDTTHWYKAWHTIINRYDSLRASFIWEGLDESVQIIHKEVNLLWIKEDWSNQTNQKEKLQQLIQLERAKGFDLSKAPLMRFNLIKTDSNKYYFIWNMHHLLTDGWCLPIILGEVVETYKSLINNKPIKLKARRPYKDYISWLLRQDQNKAKRYWEENLLGVSPTRLSDKQVAESNEHGECVLTLNTEETNQLNNYAKSLGVTINTVIQGMWSILLSKYTRQEDIVFGVTVSGRSIDLPGVEDMVGIFINTLPIRVQFKSGESIKDLLERLQIQMSEAQMYGYIPLSTIQSLQKERDLFDSIYVFENYPMPKETVSEKNNNNNRLSIRSIQGIEKTEYKLSVVVIPRKELEIRLNYNGTYFTKEDINKISRHLGQLVSNTLKNKYQYIGNISLLTEQELTQLGLWNNTQHEYPKGECVHELFEEVVQNNKDRIAVVYEDQQITYEVLNQKANQLAHY